jgi:hypothetical protein
LTSFSGVSTTCPYGRQPLCHAYLAPPPSLSKIWHCPNCTYANWGGFVTCVGPLAPSVWRRRLSLLLCRSPLSPQASVLPRRILLLPGPLISALVQAETWLVQARSALRSVLAFSLRSIKAVRLVRRLMLPCRKRVLLSAPTCLLAYSRRGGRRAVLPLPFLQLPQHSLALRGKGFAAPRRIVLAPRIQQRPLAYSLALRMRLPPLGSSYPLSCHHRLVPQVLVAHQEVLARPHWSFPLCVLLRSSFAVVLANQALMR